MKPHKIIKTFSGSQTGHDHDAFIAGDVRHLSDDLAAIVVKEGWAVPHDDSSPLTRETKVVGPEETKPLADLSFKDLTAIAKEKGIAVKPGMSKVALLEALAA